MKARWHSNHAEKPNTLVQQNPCEIDASRARRGSIHHPFAFNESSNDGHERRFEIAEETTGLAESKAEEELVHVVDVYTYVGGHLQVS